MSAVIRMAWWSLWMAVAWQNAWDHGAWFWSLLAVVVAHTRLVVRSREELSRRPEPRKP